MSFDVVNPNDKSWTKNRYVIGLGADGWTVLLVWANSLDDALDESIDWAVDNAPGLLCDDEVAQAYKEAIEQGKSEEEAYNESLSDVTCAGNYANHIHSDYWHLIAENPNREVLKSIVAQYKR